MWLLRRFILRYVAHEPLRAAATVAGVAVGVAVVVAIRLANASSIAGFQTALDTMAGRTSVEIVGAATGIDETVLAELGWLRDLGEVSPVIEGDVLVRPWAVPATAPDRPEAARPGAVSGAEAATESLDDPRRGQMPADRTPATTGEMLRVLGVDILRDRPLRDYELAAIDGTGEATRLTAQQFLELLLDPRSVILTEKFARRHGLGVGSEVAATFSDREVRLTVRGLLRDTGPARVLDGNFALMDIAAAQWAFDRLGRLDRVDVRLHDPAGIDEAERAIAARLPAGLSVQRPARRGQQVERMLAAFHLNLTALSWVALLVGLFLVYNTVSTSVVARRGEIGTLRALGVGRRRVLALFLGEAGVLALAGGVLGVGLGRLLADAAVGLTSSTVSTLYVATAAAPPALGWSDLAVAFGLAIPLSLAAAVLPALEASRVSPLAAIRGADRLETRFRLRARHWLLPASLLLLGAWLATRPPVGGVPLAGFAAAFAFVFGAAFTVPVVLFWLGRLGRVTVARLLGVEGLLANANLAGAIPRLSVSVAALAVSLSMMVAIAVMIGSFRETVVYWVGQTLTADLFVGPATRGAGARQPTVSAEVDRIVTGHPAVAAVDRFRNLVVPYGDTQIVLLATDFTVALTLGGLLVKEPRGAQARLLEAVGGDAVTVSEALANRHGLRVGDRLELDTRQGPRAFEILAIYYDYSSDRGVVSMDHGTFARHFGDVRPTGLTIHLVPGADADVVRGEMLAALGDEHRVFIYTNAALRREVLRIFDATFAITYALELIAIIVAIMGVAGTLLTLVLERRREIAMLRLVGAERGQVRRMVMYEAGLLGTVSQAVGLGVGLLLSLVLIFVINVQSFGWSIQFHVPWSLLAQMSLAIVVATVVSGLYPARIAARLHVAEEVAEE